MGLIALADAYHQVVKEILLPGISGYFNNQLLMKGQLIIAFILFSLCLARVVDWIIFSTRKENANLEMKELNTKYVERFPAFLQAVFEKPVIDTGICILFFTITGLLFIKVKKKIFFVFAVLFFVLAFW